MDLKVLVVDGRGSDWGYSHSMFEFGRYYDFFEKLIATARTIPGFKLSAYVSRIPNGSWKDESGYGEVKETPYGKPLTYVSAKEFLECAKGFEFMNQEARAALAYIRQLESDTLLGLYYH